MFKVIRNQPKGLGKSESGSVAIEFAFISSIVAVLLTGIIDVGILIYKRNDMTTAVQAGSQYFMVGGRDAAAAREVVLVSWNDRTEESTVDINRMCYCDGVEAPCTQNCPDGSLPVSYQQISATAVYRGIFRDYSYTFADDIRIR